MSYLTDKEKRLLFSALSREKEVCKQVDKESCREPYEEYLESVVESLERKFYYDRFEQEIRAKAIDEFAERMKELFKYESAWGKTEYHQRFVVDISKIDEIAEQLKGGAE